MNQKKVDTTLLEMVNKQDLAGFSQVLTHRLYNEAGRQLNEQFKKVAKRLFKEDKDLPKSEPAELVQPKKKTPAMLSSSDAPVSFPANAQVSEPAPTQPMSRVDRAREGRRPLVDGRQLQNKIDGIHMKKSELDYANANPVPVTELDIERAEAATDPIDGSGFFPMSSESARRAVLQQLQSRKQWTSQLAQQGQHILGPQIQRRQKRLLDLSP